MVYKNLNNVLLQDRNNNNDSLKDLPIEVLLSYLKKTHKVFIRHQLPFISDMVQNIEPDFFDEPEIARDLKFIFPIFVEDFIHHIYEEEKSHFGYIENLKNYYEKEVSPHAFFSELCTNSIAQILEHHKEEDDEMLGIRELTHDYHLNEKSGIYTKTVYLELKKFEDTLKNHAYIENEILFPKALDIEKKLSKRLAQFARFN